MRLLALPSNSVWQCGLILLCLPVTSWAQAVSAPTFSPAEGTEIVRFPVVVTCGTAGAEIHYTVNGVEPTLSDPVVGSGTAVMVDRGMTLKAKAWISGTSSSTASTNFEVTGDLAAGSQHMLGLVSNGQLFGWGYQDHGRLSNGSTTASSVVNPAAAKYSSSLNITNAARISAGASHSVMLDNSGNPWAFGNNAFGESGNSTDVEVLYAKRVLKSTTATDYLTNCAAVAAGLDFSGALETGGQVMLWGSQTSGRLANGQSSGTRKFAARAQTASSVELAGITDIALGKDFGLARETCSKEVPGALGRVWTWGNNTNGNLTGTTNPQLYAVKAKLNATTDLTDAWDIDAGDAHSVVVRWKTGDSDLEGTVWTFGSRANGRLGDNGSTTGTSNTPVKVIKKEGSTFSALNKIIQVSAGPQHTLALDSLGNVWAWGSNAKGELGNNSSLTAISYASKVRNPGNTDDLSNIVRVSAGGFNAQQPFSSAVAKDGTIYVWGNNQYGVFANGSTSNANSAVKLPVAVSTFKALPGFPSVTLASSVTTPNAPGAVTLTATVSDPQGAGTLQKTEFFVQGQLVATRTAAPWTASLTNLAQGTYGAYAITTDNDGNVTLSGSLSFTIQGNPDSDGDGLLDSWETEKFGNLNQTADGDPDEDKVTNAVEYAIGTNPNSDIDANADDIPDDWVVWQLSLPSGVAVSSLPANEDPDQDGLPNLVEYQRGTKPRHFDSDGDGQSDWQELAQQTNPNDANSKNLAALEVSAHQGTTNLVVAQNLLNPVSTASYNAAINAVAPAGDAYEIKTSNQGGGPAYEWIDISSTGERLAAFDPTTHPMVTKTLPFAFPFYGINYNNLYISRCGFLTLTNPGGSNPGFPVNFKASLPNAAAHRALIASYEQYLDPTSSQGSVYYQAFPDKVVVQWEAMRQSSTDALVTFQAVLYPDKTIRYNYKSISLTSGGAYVRGYLVGIQNAAGDKGLTASWEENNAQQGLLLYALDPFTVRFAAPPAENPTWVQTSASTLTGTSLSWNLTFASAGLTSGLHEGVLELRQSNGPVIYSRAVKLTVLPAGTAGNDTLAGTAWDDALFGLDGNDTLAGYGGNDNLDGGNGDDTLTGDSGDDVLSGGAGVDALDGGDGNDQLIGGDGNDTLAGGIGDDQLQGGNGNDLLEGDAGADTLKGGANDDDLRGADGSDIYEWNLGDGNDTITDSLTDTNPGTLNRLVFGSGISPSLVFAERGISNELKLTVKNASEVVIGSVTITNWSALVSGGGQHSDNWRIEFADHGGIVWTNSTIPVDADQDGMPDPWEQQYFGNASQGANDDPDGDHVTNVAEYASGTNPNSDSDENSDGIPDDWVVWQLSLPGVPASSLPASGDPDQDELTNLVEFQNGTNSRLLDTDGDGQSDWQELAQGTDPKNVGSVMPPLSVSAHQGTSNLRVPQILPNLTPALGYDISLSGNIPPTPALEWKASNVPGGPTYEWIDISSTGEHLTAFETNANTMVQKALPFAFSFYGGTYNNVYISGQGFLTLTDPGGSNPGFPVNFRSQLPNQAAHRPLIAPYEQYLEPHVQGDIFYQAFSNYVVVQWEQVKQYASDSSPTFQAVIYADGTIRCNYKSVPLTSGGSYTTGYLIGVQNAAGDAGLTSSWSDNFSQQGLMLHSLAPVSVRFAPPTSTPAPWITVSPAAISGAQLLWELNCQASQLQPGTHDTVLQLRKTAGGSVLYSRMVRLTVLPLGTAGNDTLEGTSGDDSLSGLGGNDTLNGQLGNDVLSGGSGDDMLTGGAGDDWLDGDSGKDSYFYNIGDANDVIVDNKGIHQSDDSTADYSDLYFGPGIGPGMIRSSYIPNYDANGAALKLEILGGSQGSVVIPSWNVYSSSTGVFTSHRWRFHFENGTVWSGDLFWEEFPIYPFQGVTGGNGNETLIGSDGADDIRGLLGDDLLLGGAGPDAYYYKWGDGNDVIEGETSAVHSTLVIYGASLENSLEFIFVAPDSLRIDVRHPSDLSKNGSILLKGWYRAVPIALKNYWNVYVEDASGNLKSLKATMASMSTNGPDVIALSGLHLANGSSYAAGAGNDVVTGSNWSETIQGGTGTDTIYGQGGNDTLVGNEDDDDLRGGTGSDTYIWNLGDGNDTIIDVASDSAPNIENHLVFGPDIMSSQIEMVPVSVYALKFNIRDSSGAIVGSVTINDWYKSVSGTAKHAANWRVLFAGDSAVWDGRILPTPGNDLFVGGAGDDSLQGGPGMDTLQGGDGADILLGEGGNDVLDGGNGDDQLIGGEGDDDLKGGAGSDTYLWNLGDGHDTISDLTSDPGTSIENKLVFGPGIEPSQIKLEFISTSDLRFSVRDSSDVEIGSVLIKNWYASISGGGNHAKQWSVYFSSNFTVWGGNTLVTPGPDKFVGGSDANQLLGGLGNDSIQGLDGDDVLSGQEGDDSLQGGNGNDTLYGGDGSDTLDGEAGSDALYGGVGNDYVWGGIGSDTYYWQVGDGDDTFGEPFVQDGSELNVIRFSGEVAAGVVIDRQFVKVVTSNYTEAQFVVYTPDGAILAKLKVKNWYYTKSNWRVQFPADAAPFDWQLLSMLGTSGNDSITGGIYRDEIKGFAGDDMLSGSGGNDLIEGGDGNDTIYGGSGADTLEGGEQDDVLHGDDGDDSLTGNNGNDSLYGGVGADTLTGSSGDDLLAGGPGEDRYIWVPGDGNDTLIESANPAERNHVIFGQEVLPSDIQLVPDGQNLRCEVMSAGLVVGSVTFNNWYLPNYGRWLIEFGNGVIWDRDNLATPGNDVLTGSVRDDNLVGEEGNDSLSGGAGNDVIEGGLGDDVLTGGTGSNQYIYQIGDGNDQIYPAVNPAGLKDRLSLIDIARSAVSIETLNAVSPLEVKITILSNGQTIFIHGGNFLLIEFSDATVEFNSLGEDTRLNTNSVLAGWHDDDDDGVPNDVENALNAFNATLADAQDGAITPAVDTIVDSTLTTALGNRYPSLSQAVAAAQAGRGGKPYIVIRVEPGVYNEDLDLNVNGVFIQGPGSLGRATLLRKNRYTDPQVSGERIIFNGLCFGDGSTPLKLALNATDYVEGIRFANCLFRDQSLASQVFAPQPVTVTSGNVSFVHCSFLRLAGMKVTNANVKFVNSLVESVRGASWTGTQQIFTYSSLVNFNVPVGWQGFGVRNDGLLKVVYPGKISQALGKVAQSDRLVNGKDLDGELRDSSPDIGCDEYVDAENGGAGDQLADYWELKCFGNLNALPIEDPDADSKSNLVEYDAETDPLNATSTVNPSGSIDWTSANSYGSTNLLGENPLPDVGSANWVYTSDGDITFSGRQGDLDYRIDVVEPVVAALFLNAKFQSIGGTGTIPGAARIYLDGQLMKELNGPLNNVLIPLYLLSTGTHTIRIELINAQRDYRPVIDSISVRPLATSDVTAEQVAASVNQIITLPFESLTSPAFVEGQSMARGSISLNVPSQGIDVEVQAGADQFWFANVPLVATLEHTDVEISFGSGQLTEQHLIRWAPTILEQIPLLTIRKGDALRLQALAAGTTAGASIEYQVDGQHVGSAVLGAAYNHSFASAGTFVVTATIGGVPIEGAQTTVTVVEASFGPSALVAARSTSSTIQLPLVPASLTVEGSVSLALTRNGSAIAVRPTANGPQQVVARISPGGPIVAVGTVNVFSLSGTGSNGGGRVIESLSDSRDLINMSYVIDGPIPSNLRIKVTVWIPGTTFLDGSTVAWLSAKDFDEFGVANLQVIYSYAGSYYGRGHGLCQHVELFLAE